MNIQGMPKNRATLMHLRKVVAQSRKQLGTLDMQRKLLTAEAIRIRRAIVDVQRELTDHTRRVEEWIGVYADTSFDLHAWVTPVSVETTPGNIGSVKTETLTKVVFVETLPDPAESPLWVDAGIEAVRTAVELQVKIEILQRNYEAVEQERKRVTRLYNYLDKIRIPSLEDFIRVIGIELDDQQREENVVAMIAGSLQQRGGLA